MNRNRIVVVGLGIGVFLNLVGIVGNGVLLRGAWAEAVPYLGIARIGWLPAGVVAATSAVALAGFLPAAWLTARGYRD